MNSNIYNSLLHRGTQYAKSNSIQQANNPNKILIAQNMSYIFITKYIQCDFFSETKETKDEAKNLTGIFF